MANTIQFGQVQPKDPAFRIGLGAFTPPDLASQANLVTSPNGFIQQGLNANDYSTQTLNGVAKAYSTPNYTNPTTPSTGGNNGTYTPPTPNGVNNPISIKGNTIDFSKYLSQMADLNAGLGELNGMASGGTGTQNIQPSGGGNQIYVDPPKPEEESGPVKPGTINGLPDQITGIQNQLSQQVDAMSQGVASMNPDVPPTSSLPNGTPPPVTDLEKAIKAQYLANAKANGIKVTAISADNQVKQVMASMQGNIDSGYWGNDTIKFNGQIFNNAGSSKTMTPNQPLLRAGTAAAVSMFSNALTQIQDIKNSIGSPTQQ